MTTNDTPSIIMGDMNAWTCVLCHQSPHWRNCDITINANGNLVIDLCNSFDMQISNCRFRGDCWGKYTKTKVTLHSRVLQLFQIA